MSSKDYRTFLELIFQNPYAILTAYLLNLVGNLLWDANP
jgi:hypothetical protein